MLPQNLLAGVSNARGFRLNVCVRLDREVDQSGDSETT